MDETHGIDVHDKSSVDFHGSDSAKRPRVQSSSPNSGAKTDIGKRIFCNRPLNMKNIVAVGFDMDYTLAQYMPKTFESLAYQHTVEKLVYDLKYPREVCPVNLVLILTIFSCFYSSFSCVNDDKSGIVIFFFGFYLLTSFLITLFPSTPSCNTIFFNCTTTKAFFPIVGVGYINQTTS